MASDTPAPAVMDNATLSAQLREMAALLDAQGDEGFRAAAYRRAADTVAGWAEPMATIHARDGLDGLDALPTIGPGIAQAIGELLRTGHWSRLERLRGSASPEALLRTVPGIGPALALRLHDELGIDSLEALERAAHDGRLERVPQLGPRRVETLRATLAQRLGRRAAAPPSAGPEPPVSVLLEVDRAYRTAAEAGSLRTIAPRRFNPDGHAWLPVMHTRRGDWVFTALYSNTARAHELGRVRDWVVLYAEDRQHHERQYTVVTAHGGPLAGQRVVRGREGECRAWYAQGEDDLRG